MLLLLLFALHPLLRLANLIPDSIRPPIDLSFLAWGVELVVMAGWMQHLSPANMPHASGPPIHTTSLSGFRIRAVRAISRPIHTRRAVIGTIASTTGITVLIAQYLFFSESGLKPTIWPLFFGLNTIGHGVLQAGTALLVGHFRWAKQPAVDIELDGRLFRVGASRLAITSPPAFEALPGGIRVQSGEQALEVRAPPHVLIWLQNQFAGMTPAGGREEVPDALAEMRGR